MVCSIAVGSAYGKQWRNPWISERGESLTKFPFPRGAASTVISFQTDDAARRQPNAQIPAVNGPDSGIPSVARLYLVNDECEEVRAGSVYVSLSQCVLKFFDGFVDREFGSIADIGGSELLNRLEPSVIEGAIQIVDGVSSDESDLVETRSLSSRVWVSRSVPCFG